jgi:hypothetical protein
MNIIKRRTHPGSKADDTSLKLSQDKANEVSKTSVLRILSRSIVGSFTAAKFTKSTIVLNIL